MKKIVKKARNVGIAQSKRMLNKTPKTKNAIIKSIRATEKITGLNILAIQNDYKLWLKNHTPTKIQLDEQKLNSANFKYRPLISVITPVYNTPPKLLRECINSVLNQTYDNWELILIDDCSSSSSPRDVIIEYTNQDSRIKKVFNTKNLHIANATNEGVRIAKGEYIALLDHDDVLYPQALYEVAGTLNIKKHDFMYSDEDKLSENGKVRFNPFFKPDWSPDFLRSINYITHFTVIKKSLINRIGGFRDEYNGAQDWDLFLRATRATKSIYHIQDILYGWRMSNNSTAQESSAKPYVVQAQKKALLDDVIQRGLKAAVETSKYNKDFWNVNSNIEGNPLVSIVIPSKNQYEIVKRCIESILQKSTYTNYEIILVDTGSDDKQVLNWYRTLNNNKIKIHSWIESKFSYSNSCNYGAKKSRGEYLVMLNNDTEVITPNWIEAMLGDAQRKEVGTVGARLYFPGNKYIQHAGVGVGLGGYAANLLSGVEESMLNTIQKLYADNKRNVSCSTAACLMIEKDLFLSSGGFDNKFSVTYNDVDLGLRLLDNGYVNIYNPGVVLIHHESMSLGRPEEKRRETVEFNKSKELLKLKWKKLIIHDPYYNDNFSKGHANFALNSL